MASKLTFQEAILKLQEFWAGQGCIIWQPYHTEVGAGTMNPATFLRVLGPEPWRVAYVEPSIRPADGRYGENPNRWQHYYQFQVILKPDPGNPQEIYLQSLLALGIDPVKNDIRFVEDNWEAPALGAWGLGWEVWLNGSEITQYTYFQQAGGQLLDPVSVEITYGIERIVMALQGVDSFVEMDWNQDRSYGDIALDSEVEFNRYNFETADIERLRGIFDEYEAEAKSCVGEGLILPAHDYILKCSHTFNILDSRGAIGVADRADLFGRMRSIAGLVAEEYVKQREDAGFPWMEKTTPMDPAATELEPAPLGKLASPAPLLIEVGTEELPSSDLSSAVDQLREHVEPMLEEARLEHGPVRIMGTPRRLVIYVENLSPQQSEERSLIKGPPAERAFNEDGAATPAGEGFARSVGVGVEALKIDEIDGGKYVVAQISKETHPASEVLVELIPELLGRLRFEKSMRWNSSGVYFSRPVRWLVGLHGKEIIPFRFADQTAGRSTRLLRFSDPDQVDIPTADKFLEILSDAGIVLDIGEREESIRAQMAHLLEEVGGTIAEDPGLLEEVTNLVEQPTALRGGLKEEDLNLPMRVLVSVMKTHQRYFPVEKDGKLLPYFLMVRNGGAEYAADVVKGNEQVVRARFADAAYFIQRDLQHPLESYLSLLGALTFQKDLGSVLDKVRRLMKIVPELAPELGLSVDELQTAVRAAELSKADLATLMVIEMTSLQGEMGREYALHSGEDQAVAQAIFEHYLPRHAGDQVPQTLPGISVAIADRLDSLLGLLAVGLKPSGTSDPFGLRRSAIGLIQILRGHGLRLNLSDCLQIVARHLPINVEAEMFGDCLDFIKARQQVLLLGEGRKHDVVEAILAEQGHDPAGAAQAVEELEEKVAQTGWLTILQSYSRCARITRGEEVTSQVDEQLFSEKEERALFTALLKAEAAERMSGSVVNFFTAFDPLVPVITEFFDEVLVMDEDLKVRSNRLALLQRIVSMAHGVADFSKLEGF